MSAFNGSMPWVSSIGQTSNSDLICTLIVENQFIILRGQWTNILLCHEVRVPDVKIKVLHLGLGDSGRGVHLRVPGIGGSEGQPHSNGLAELVPRELPASFSVVL